jgi:cyclopropane fatty-acyl-phospholipid synthase-like methyltransferase
MEDFKLLVDFHLAGQRQGPGGDAETKLAVELTGLKNRKGLHIADIGCGTGASTLVLARELDAKITAIDLFPDFLNVLDQSISKLSIGSHIQAKVASMEELPFAKESLDLIWSEGAIYNMGFKKGIQEWRQFLKLRGVLAVSEITWLTTSRPNEINDHWSKEYPEIATASEKIKLLEEAGYKLMGYFPLPSSCWLENYYKPMEARFDDFIQRHPDSKLEAIRIVENEKREIELYEKYQAYFSYGFYIAEKV